MRRRSRSRSKKFRFGTPPKDDNKKRSRSRLPRDFAYSMLMPITSLNDQKEMSAVQRAGLHPLFTTRILDDLGEAYVRPFKFADPDIKFSMKEIKIDLDDLYVYDILHMKDDSFLLSIDGNLLEYSNSKIIKSIPLTVENEDMILVCYDKFRDKIYMLDHESDGQLLIYDKDDNKFKHVNSDIEFPQHMYITENHFLSTFITETEESYNELRIYDILDFHLIKTILFVDEEIYNLCWNQNTNMIYTLCENLETNDYSIFKIDDKYNIEKIKLKYPPNRYYINTDDSGQYLIYSIDRNEIIIFDLIENITVNKINLRSDTFALSDEKILIFRNGMFMNYFNF